MEPMKDKISAYKMEVSALNENMPEVANAYHQFTGVCMQEGTLDAKTKQLIALGISLSSNNEVCTYYHLNEAVSKGATEQEIMETVAVAGAVGAGYVFSQGLTRVQHTLSGSELQ